MPTANENNNKNNFENVYILLIVFMLGIVIGWNLIFIFLKEIGLSVSEMLLFVAVTYATYLFLSMVMKRLSSNRSIKISLIVRAISFLLLISVFSRLQIYVAAALTGVITMMYWIPFNIKVQNATEKRESAFKSGLTSVVAPTLTAVITLAGAGLVEHYGYPFLFIAAAFMMILAYFYVDKTGPHFEIALSISKGLKSVARVKSLFYIQGFWEGFFWFTIPMITLSFTNSVTMFGAFLTYVAIFGIIATLLVARMSDKKRNRVAFIVPIFLLTAFFMVVSYLATDFVVWTLLNSGIAFFSAMMAPFMGAVLKDKIEDVHNGVFGREILLNAGRLSACIVMAITILLGEFKISLLLAAIAIVMYVVFLFREKIY